MSRAGKTSVASPAAHSETAAAVARPRQRNIVLLSDGTGNSAAKLHKTNVWWLYQALDLGEDDQIALYDDGVGTSGFRLLQWLGGAIGLGLSRNVRDLYEFLCRHYRPGDHIYVFGFSRGAFTVRTLAGLVCKCGILDQSRTVPRFQPFRLGYEDVQLNTDDGLTAGVRLAYRSYRRGYDDAPFARLYRWLRDRLLRPVAMPEEFRRRHALEEAPDEKLIKFIGVWDTVDAVGLPVDELSTMVDRLFYPHRFPDQSLSQKVERACHAIAVDDERHTFHPVLWNEGGAADSERIEQVWFAGMHSDVGGGYPDDDLASVSLCWMIGKVRFEEERGEGLRFDPEQLREIEQRAQALGKMHDSRRGLGVYYRYNPRNVWKLCHDADNRVEIDEPKIHHAVLKRIANNTAGYAPPGLPTSYRLVDAHGRVSELNPPTYETASGRERRAELLSRAQDHVFWRRVLYYGFVLVTLALLAMPYYRAPIPGAVPESTVEAALTKTLGLAPAVLPGFLGSWAGYWTASWAQSPYLFLVLAVVYGLLHWHSRSIDGNIRRLTEAGWWHVKRPPGPKPDVSRVGPFERIARTLRGSGRLQRIRRGSIRWGVPIVAAVFALYVLGTTVYRATLHREMVAGGVCATWLRSNAAPSWHDVSPAGDSITFDPRTPCLATGLILQEGQRYSIEVDARGWKDGETEADPDGLSGMGPLAEPAFLGGVPARRHLALPWFTLVAEIRPDSDDVFPFTRTEFIWEAPRAGGLYLYVNDAINPGVELADLNVADADGLPITEAERASAKSEAWYAFYLNNRGTATIRVRPVN
jgi:hypothetical protein